MGEFIIFILIFVGIMAVSALIFGGWLITMIVRGIAGFLGVRSDPPMIPHQGYHGPGGPRRPSGATQIGPVAGHRQCQYELCKAPNDGRARFCRRCGRELTRPAQVHVRRAAVW
jgi:ribosomal protein L40E